MCGIMAYIGKKDATPVLLSGLRRLEYRGYDSAGLAILQNDKLVRFRAVGKVDNLAEKVKNEKLNGVVGIAHTRWATHGGVNETNTHPHGGCDDSLMIVHNGIIENYREIKKELDGHEIKSETDTEILAHLIEKNYEGDLKEAVVKSLLQVRGTYGIVAMHKNEPQKLVAARMGSPLVVGIGEGEYFLASDASPILPYTKQVVFLNDGEVAEITENSLQIYNLKDQKVEKKIEELTWNEEQAQKQGFPHFMLKEIFDQPTVFEDAIAGRIHFEEGTAVLGGLNMTPEQMKSINRIILIACGTASYAGMIGKFAFERLAGIPTDVEIASEFRYKDPIVDEHTLVFGISQSGETADTLAALREAKRKGAYIRGIINVVGSTIARETDGGTYIHAGPELAVASTKAYTNMVAILLLYAIQFGRNNKMTLATGKRLITAIKEIPEKMDAILAQSEKIKEIALKYKDYRDFYFLGRGINYPVALEGSLKLKEISYIHSEAYPGGEMKHGPISLLDEDFPVFAIVTQNQLYEKMVSNITEAKARKAKIVVLATEGDEEIKHVAEDVIYVPPTMELLEPLLNTLPLQLFAYHITVALGKDVDRPRNLAKSVTVE